MIDPPTRNRPLGFHVFDQAVVWAGPDGVEHPIDRLDLHERREVLAWLHDNVYHFYLQALSRQVVSGALRHDERVPDFVFISADDWLASTVLVKALTGTARPASGRARTRRRYLWVLLGHDGGPRAWARRRSR
jgi:hypothetical protein